MSDKEAITPPLLRAIANRKRYAAERHEARAVELREEAQEYEAELRTRTEAAS